MAKMRVAKSLQIPTLDMDFKLKDMLTGQPKTFIKLVLVETLPEFPYIMGMEDKKYLPETYGKKIGKANVTGYCIKFKALKDINIDILEEAIKEGVRKTTNR